DVHLFADPESCYSDRPLLFVDCEGINGGQISPAGAVFAKGRHQSEREYVLTLEKEKSKRYIKDIPKHVRNLKFSKLPMHSKRGCAEISSDEEAGSSGDQAKIGSRMWAVQSFYPRILYTFSDAVVYVTNNQRSVSSFSQSFNIFNRIL